MNVQSPSERLYYFVFTPYSNHNIDTLVESSQHHAVQLDVHELKYGPGLLNDNDLTHHAEKNERIRNVLKSLNSDTMVLLTHSADVLCTQPASVLIAAFKTQFSRPIVASPDGAIMMGYVSALRQWYQMCTPEMMIKRSPLNVAMQNLMQYDTDHKLFVSTRQIDANRIEFRHGKAFLDGASIALIHFDNMYGVMNETVQKWRKSLSKSKPKSKNPQQRETYTKIAIVLMAFSVFVLIAILYFRVKKQ